MGLLEAQENSMDRWAFLALFCLSGWLPTVGLYAQTAHSAPVTVGQTESGPAPQLEDAALHDVVFVDREYGWAVGDHGAIWHTTDGGQNWRQQRSTVDVGLQGVCFVDRERGWAVGGATQPYLWTSQAIVLKTTDGGQTWQQQLAFLPALARVKFFNAEQGLAWGRGAGGEPLGVFASDDGGRNWRSVAVGPQSAWWDGDFVDKRTGVVVGTARKIARIAHGDVAQISLDENHAGNPRAVRLAADGSGWLAGDGGLIARTFDGGQSWQLVDILPTEIRDCVNWQAITIHGRHVWIAGSPGTVVLHSPDGGETWQGHATGNNLPINRITFVDETHGWAVGDMGAILHTNDGGQTWQEQRGGGQAAVLVLLADENQHPLEALAKLSSDGYRTVVHLLDSQQDSQHHTAHARLAEAMAFLGCNAVTRSSLNSTSGAELRAELLTDIVRQVRLWRPAVVVLPDGTGGDARATRIAEVAEEAIPQAADENRLSELTDQLALAPWQVSRTFALLPAETRGTHRVLSSDGVPFKNQTLGEISISARSLLQREFRPGPDSNEFQLKMSLAGEPTAAVDDLAAGLSLTPGSDCRRAFATHHAAFDPQAQRRLAEKRRNLTNIFRFAEGNPALLGQVGQMIADLDPAAGASLLFEVAAHFQQTGQIDLAASTRELLFRRFPNDPLADQCLVWLVQYYASSETAHAYRQIATEITQAIAREENTGPQSQSFVQPATAIDQNETAPAANPTLADRRFTRAAQFAEHIAHTRPLLYSEPQVRVPWAIAERKRGFPDAADRYLQSLAIRALGDPWQECGAVERWLAEPNKPAPPKPRVICRFTGDKPRLDGKLDEKFWQTTAVTLESESSDPAIRNPKSEIHLAHDEQFLYFALRCAKHSDLSYTTESRPRTYDAQLGEHARVQIL